MTRGGRPSVPGRVAGSHRERTVAQRSCEEMPGCRPRRGPAPLIRSARTAVVKEANQLLRAAGHVKQTGGREHDDLQELSERARQEAERVGGRRPEAILRDEQQVVAEPGAVEHDRCADAGQAATDDDDLVVGGAGHERAP